MVSECKSSLKATDRNCTGKEGYTKSIRLALSRGCYVVSQKSKRKSTKKYIISLSLHSFIHFLSHTDRGDAVIAVTGWVEMDVCRLGGRGNGWLQAAHTMNESGSSGRQLSTNEWLLQTHTNTSKWIIVGFKNCKQRLSEHFLIWLDLYTHLHAAFFTLLG